MLPSGIWDDPSEGTGAALPEGTGEALLERTGVTLLGGTEVTTVSDDVTVTILEVITDVNVIMVVDPADVEGDSTTSYVVSHGSVTVTVAPSDTLVCVVTPVAVVSCVLQSVQTFVTVAGLLASGADETETILEMVEVIVLAIDSELTGDSTIV